MLTEEFKSFLFSPDSNILLTSEEFGSNVKVKTLDIHRNKVGELLSGYKEFTEIVFIPQAYWKWYDRGRFSYYLGKFKEAIIDFDRAIEINPNKYAHHV